MRKNDYEIKEELVTHKKFIRSNLFCDVCNKRIEHKSNYYTLSTGHYDWGNDSCESIENFDICSGDCLKLKLQEYIDDTQKSNTHYFNVEHDWFNENLK